MKTHENIIDSIFKAQDKNGFWKMLDSSDKSFPTYLHYLPNFKASLWTLILLADLGHDRDDDRVQKALNAMKNHFFDKEAGLFTLKEDHYPIPCLNGNMIYLDSYFNKKPSEESFRALEFFHKNQRFDDGEYIEPKNEYTRNTSCYGRHTCYWGIVKLLKGISFIDPKFRSESIENLKKRCIDFILLHQVCFSSHKNGKIMINKLDKLTFPNMYKSDFLEILWLLKRESVKSSKMKASLDLLKSKKQTNDFWLLERKLNNLTASVGELGQANRYITERAKKVLVYYSK